MASLVSLFFALFISCTFTHGTSQLGQHLNPTCFVNNSCSTNLTKENLAQCPVLFQCKKFSKCECSHKLDWRVLCSENLQEAASIPCQCITYDSKSNVLMFGFCSVQCGMIQEERNQDNNAFYNIPRDINSLNSSVCGTWNRDGFLCGKCQEEHYPQVYSYNVTCIYKEKCKGKYGDLLKYLLAAYGPLTVFCFLILLFRINVTSSYLLAYVIFSQTITTSFFLRPVFSLTNESKKIQLGLKILTSINSVWRLDFFKSVYTICLKLDSLTIIALDYCIALYPFLFTFLSYQLIKLYDRKIPLLTAIWKPMRCFLLFFNKNIDTQTTVIDAYTTFFLLSYSKIMSISFELLMPIKLNSVYTNETKLVLYYDGTKEYFHRKHLPYGLLAIIMCSLFNLLPVAVLFFYQSKCFQVLLSHLPFKHFSLKATMDLLLSCYKDGTEPGTRDCRWFLATSLSYWFAFFVCFAATLDSMFLIYGAIYCIAFLELLVIVQPYKNEYFHFFKLHYALEILLGIIFLLGIATTLSFLVLNDSVIKCIFVMALIIVLIPHVILVISTFQWLISHCTPN